MASQNRFAGLPVEGDEHSGDEMPSLMESQDLAAAGAPAVRVTIQEADEGGKADAGSDDEGGDEIVDAVAALKAEVTAFPTHQAMIKTYNPETGGFTVLCKDGRTLRGYVKEFKKPVGVHYEGWAEDCIEDIRREAEGETDEDCEPLSPPYIVGFQPGSVVFVAKYTVHTKDPRSGEKRSHTNVWNVRPAIKRPDGKFECNEDGEFETTDVKPERKRAKCCIRADDANVFEGVCIEWNTEDWEDDDGHQHRKGTGYIEYEGLDGRTYKIHVHFSALDGTPEGKFKRLYDDQEVEFIVKTTRRGGRTMRCAEQVTGPDCTYFSRPQSGGAGAAGSDEE